MKTKSAKQEEVTRRWYLVDVQDKVLGRVSTKIATILRGKHKPEYTPHTDTGDFVIVVNAEKVRLTGKKEEKKLYQHHTGWPGGLISKPASVVREREPKRMIKQAVWGMLPHGTLGRAMFSKLKIYVGPEHPHTAQKPEVLPL